MGDSFFRHSLLKEQTGQMKQTGKMGVHYNTLPTVIFLKTSIMKTGGDYFHISTHEIVAENCLQLCIFIDFCQINY